MPSGSHSGSFGSHSSGGSSFGGSHNSSSGSSRGFYPGGIIFFGGRSYKFKSKISGVLSFICILTLIAGLICALITGMSKSTIGKIEADYRYYQNMIQKAESDPQYKTTGYITDKFRNEDCGKWYLTYKFKTTDDSKWVKGYTYSVYTEEEAYSVEINSEIELAVNSYPITTETDSVNMDYKNKSLTDDGEYTLAKKQIVGFRTGYILCFITFTVSLVSCIILEYREKQKDKLENLNFETTKTSQQSQDSKTHICPYCGTKLKENDYSCPNCGASTK